MIFLVYMTKDDIIHIQARLNDAYMLPVKADGIWGPVTKGAVLWLQLIAGQPLDGVPGPVFTKALDGPVLSWTAPALTDADWAHAASLAGCGVRELKAAAMVESAGRGGFSAPCLPRALFEGHLFWRNLTRAHMDPLTALKGNTDILYKAWTKKYYIGGLDEYTRVFRAMAVNPDAALMSASWGMFQILGSNHKACGEASVRDMVRGCMRSEAEQLAMFIRFISGRGLIRYLKAHDWAGYARRYNGPSYAANRYDVRLKEAYEKAGI